MKIKSIEGKETKDSLSRKKRRQLERKLVKVKRNAWQQGKKIPMSIDLLQPSVDEPTKKKVKKKKKQSDELTIDDQVRQTISSF